MHRQAIVCISLLTQLIFVSVGELDAQTPLVQEPNRPFQGLYRGNRPDTQSPHSLMLGASLHETYDDNLLAEGTSATPGQPQSSGVYTRVSGSLNYSFQRRTTEFFAGGDAGLEFYPELTNEIDHPLPHYGGSVGLAGQLGRSRLRVAQSVRREPFFSFDFTDPVVSPDLPLIATDGLVFRPDVALLDEPVITYDTSASLSTNLSRRTTLDVSYGFSGSTESTQWTTLNSQGVNVRLGRSLSRTTQLEGSYVYRFGSYETVLVPRADVTSHQADIGMRYTRSLSRTRSVTVAGGGGGNSVDDEFLTQVDPTVGQSNGVSGYANLAFQFARTWSANVDYRRTLQLFQGIRQPYFGNAVSFGLQGEPSGRVDVSVGGMFMSGDATASALSNPYDTFNFSARVRFAISRNLAAVAEYLRSRYEFESGLTLPPGVLPGLERNLFSVGISFGMPLVGR